MRGRMRDAASYAAPVAIGEVMSGGTVGEVVKSNHPDYKVGDIVEDRLGWQEYAIGPGPALRKIDPSLAPISTANGVLGMPGLTAYAGLFKIGAGLRPGETVFVSAASGAVGSISSANSRKRTAAYVVGSAGSDEKKCQWLPEQEAQDRQGCINYKTTPSISTKRVGAPRSPRASTSTSKTSAANTPLEAALNHMKGFVGRIRCVRHDRAVQQLRTPSPGPWNIIMDDPKELAHRRLRRLELLLGPSARNSHQEMG